jgi:hypothetical protein
MIALDHWVLANTLHLLATVHQYVRLGKPTHHSETNSRLDWLI